VPAAPRSSWRLAVVPLALAWLIIGLFGAYVYAHRYDLYRGFPAPKTPAGVPKGTVKTVNFYSPSLHATHSYIVYLPPHYAQQAARGRRFPVLYLLHGDPGKPDIFIRAGALAVKEDVLAAKGAIKPMIAVMPAGKTGTFAGSGTEWANAQSGPWESYVLDVVHNVDRRFATVPSRQGRGIAGLSEGGFGALNISLHHLGVFSVAESWSGYFNETRAGPFSREPTSVIRLNSPEQDVRAVAPQIRRLGYRAWIYQGQLDHNPAFHIRNMSNELHAAGAQVHYGFFPGGHDWGLWRAQLPRMLVAASNWFATNPHSGANALSGIGHAGSPAAIRRAELAQHTKCLRRRARRLRAGRPPGHACHLGIARP
jgi:enterochelin esterase-like enzyme